MDLLPAEEPRGVREVDQPHSYLLFLTSTRIAIIKKTKFFSLSRQPSTLPSIPFDNQAPSPTRPLSIIFT
jgi:hypothetical protein